MYCQNCGDFVDGNSYQKLGPLAEGYDGEPVEADLFVCAGVCDRCGTHNQTEYADGARSENFLILLDYEENTY